MLALITGMLLCIGLAVSVVGVVAIPARREGRELFRHVPAAPGADDDPDGAHHTDGSEPAAVGASERRGADVSAG